MEEEKDEEQEQEAKTVKGGDSVFKKLVVARNRLPSRQL